MTRQAPPPAASRFRNRKLNWKQPLQVYFHSELKDLDESSNLHRVIPVMETGVDKEEEEEHHLQAAISASQSFTTTGEAVAPSYIPTPDASRTIPAQDYESLYKKTFSEPSTFIRYSTTLEDDMQNKPTYCMDEEDASFLTGLRETMAKELGRGARRTKEGVTEDEFEIVVAQLEKVANEEAPHLGKFETQEANIASSLPNLERSMEAFVGQQLANLKPLLSHIYPHWVNRRVRRIGKTITPQLKYEDSMVVKDENDPYVCFRRRETKPIRKTRRTDQQSLEKLRKLRSEMETARSILEMITRRERMRQQSLSLEHVVFDTRCQSRHLQRVLGIKEDDDLMPRKKRKLISQPLTPDASTIKLKIPIPGSVKREENMIPGFDRMSIIEEEIRKRKEMDIGWEDVTDLPFQPFPVPIPGQFWRALHPTAPQSMKPSSSSRQPSYRRRVGRGGRIFLDRRGFKPTSIANALSNLDTERVREKKEYYERMAQRYKYDDDGYGSEMDYVVVDESKDALMRVRATYLTEHDQKSLITLPSFNPSEMKLPSPGSVVVNATAVMAANANGIKLNGNNVVPVKINGTTVNGIRPAINGNNTVGSPTTAIPGTPIKRQNSKPKMIPQQQAQTHSTGIPGIGHTAGSQQSSASIPAISSPTLNTTVTQVALLQQQQQQQQQQQASRTPIQLVNQLTQQQSNNKSMQLHQIRAIANANMTNMRSDTVIRMATNGLHGNVALASNGLQYTVSNGVSQLKLPGQRVAAQVITSNSGALSAASASPTLGVSSSPNLAQVQAALSRQHFNLHAQQHAAAHAERAAGINVGVHGVNGIHGHHGVNGTNGINGMGAVSAAISSPQLVATMAAALGSPLLPGITNTMVRTASNGSHGN